MNLENQQTPSKVSLKQKIAWGCGGLADNYIINLPGQLAMPIYNIVFGINAMLLGFALALPRIIDAFFDVMVGNWSDNTRTKWGRRKPWIVAGVTLSAILLPLLWMPPFESSNGRFGWFLGLSIIYFMSYSLFVVPFTAFGYELTDDYNEKTRVLAWRMYIGLLGSLTIPWVYKLCFLPIFNGDEVLGAKWVSFGASFIILFFGLMPLLCTERKEAIKQEKVPFKNALKDTLKNRAFLVLLSGCTLIQVCLFTAGTLGLYVYIYVVSQGNKESAAELLGWCGSATALFCYASLPMATWLSTRIGKKQALITCLGIVLLSILGMYPILNPHVPTLDLLLLGHSFKIPYLQMIPAVIFGIGIQGAWLMTNSMTADVCDEDELQTGLRQEGIYGAVSGFAMKSALGISSIGGGILLKVAGFKEGLPPDACTSTNLKHLYLIGQSVGILAGIAILFFYPISKERALEIRVILNERKKRA